MLHFTLVPVSLSVPFVFDWKRELAKLSPMNREVVWVHGAYVVATVIALGLLTLVGRHAMIAGEPLGLGLAAFAGLFWLGRLAIQLLYYNKEHWPQGRIAWLGRHALTVLFAYWTAVYLTVFAAALAIER